MGIMAVEENVLLLCTILTSVGLTLSYVCENRSTFRHYNLLHCVVFILVFYSVQHQSSTATCAAALELPNLNYELGLNKI